MIDIWEAIKTPLVANQKYNEGIKRGYTPLNRNLFRQYNKFRPSGPKPLFCYLPYTSLTFSFQGQVFVCSYNRDILLGRYPTNTIEEIWNGDEAKRLREHMMYNDLDYGCRHCKFFFDKGKFSNLRPLVFDKYYKSADKHIPKVFEFELSNECNLECQMCHGEVSSSIRKNREKLPPFPNVYDDKFVEQLTPYIPLLKEAKFYGGEPFLIPIYYKIWDKIKELNPELELFVITNGTHWNSKIEKLITELNFDVAISIDAFEKEKVERIRKNVVYEKLMDNINRFSEICNKKGKHLSLSFTVQKDNWEQLPLIINLCNRVNAYIYISYLERPVQFALSNLAVDEWKKIREYMNQFTFPISTAKEKHNNKCFDDFKHYLDNYITSPDTKKYADYKFDRNALLSNHIENNADLPAYKPTSLNELEIWLQIQYKNQPDCSTQLTQHDLLTRVTKLMMPYSESDKAILRGFIVETGLPDIITNLTTTNDEQLIKQSDAALKQYRLINNNSTTA